MVHSAAVRAPLRVLGIAGSVRRGSYNRALLEAARELAPPEMTLSIHDLSPLPLFRAETEPPPEVRAFIAAIAAADALLVATPEYNYGVPAVLCSAFEWASQPPCSSVLRGKPAAVMGASTGRGGTVRAQLQLRQAFVYTGVCALLQPELMVDRAQDHFSADGRLEAPALRDRLSTLLSALSEWTCRLAGPAREPHPLIVPILPDAADAADANGNANGNGNGNGASPAPHGAAGAVLQQG